MKKIHQIQWRAQGNKQGDEYIFTDRWTQTDDLVINSFLVEMEYGVTFCFVMCVYVCVRTSVRVSWKISIDQPQDRPAHGKGRANA